jgi:hypothetical protein
MRLVSLFACSIVLNVKTGVFASEVIPGEVGKKPVTIKMIDAKTKEHVETLEVDACLVSTGRVPNVAGLGLDVAGIETERGFVQVDEHMRVLNKKGGQTVPNLYCIGDANGKMMLAHAASAQVGEAMKENRKRNDSSVALATFLLYHDIALTYPDDRSLTVLIDLSCSSELSPCPNLQSCSHESLNQSFPFPSLFSSLLFPLSSRLFSSLLSPGHLSGGEHRGAAPCGEPRRHPGRLLHAPGDRHGGAQRGASQGQGSRRRV